MMEKTRMYIFRNLDPEVREIKEQFIMMTLIHHIIIQSRLLITRIVITRIGYNVVPPDFSADKFKSCVASDREVHSLQY